MRQRHEQFLKTRVLELLNIVIVEIGVTVRSIDGRAS